MSRVSRRKKKKQLRKKRILLTVAAVILLYIAGILFFQSHFYPQTYVGDIGIGICSRNIAKKRIQKELIQFTVSVEEPEGTEKISGEEAGIFCKDFDYLNLALKKQNSFLWPVQIWNKYTYHNLNIKVDRAKLQSFVETMKCMHPKTPVASENAKIVYNKEKKEYMIEKESTGNIIDPVLFVQGITDAFSGLDSSISLKDDTYYKKPEYTASSTAVRALKDQMNQCLNGTVTYRDGGLKKTLSRNKIADFLEYTNDFTLIMNEKQIQSFVKKNVSPVFNSVKGKIPEGLTAWKVDVKKEADTIMQNLQDGKKTKRKPIYSTEGFDREKESIGRTYIDVSLPNQKMWYVEDGKIMMSSDVVTGNLSTGHGTSVGLYHIEFKQRDHLMVKYNSFVHYWMPYNTTIGVGFHDASWRSSFGGNIFRTNGSHGCINMPSGKAAELFGMINTGTPVYIHW
ncbi:MAG: L,D-transpeptidase [Anaerobutyricum sp.]|nr:L,D-transpeptidase [Anaerobutyricum sp.]